MRAATQWTLTRAQKSGTCQRPNSIPNTPGAVPHSEVIYLFGRDIVRPKQRDKRTNIVMSFTISDKK